MPEDRSVRSSDPPVAVDIVVATYNGAAHLRAQLDSLLAQTHSSWRALIRDDGSTDATLDVVREYVARFPDRFELVVDGRRAGGAAANFGLLLERAAAPYVMCCDQDDVWLPDKVERFVRAMRFHEGVFGEDTPLLVHSDLQVVGADLAVLHPSFWAYQHLDPAWPERFGRALTQNVVTGCALMANRALLARALPVPPEAVMHDWWLALVASAFGRVVALPEATVLYRQHGRNDVGAKRWDAAFVARRVLSLLDRNEVALGLARTAAQANAFAVRFPDAPPEAALYAGLPRLGWWARRRRAWRHGFLKIGRVRTLGWLLLL